MNLEFKDIAWSLKTFLYTSQVLFKAVISQKYSTSMYRITKKLRLLADWLHLIYAKVIPHDIYAFLVIYEQPTRPRTCRGTLDIFTSLLLF